MLSNFDCAAKKFSNILPIDHFRNLSFRKNQTKQKFRGGGCFRRKSADRNLKFTTVKSSYVENFCQLLMFVADMVEVVVMLWAKTNVCGYKCLMCKAFPRACRLNVRLRPAHGPSNFVVPTAGFVSSHLSIEERFHAEKLQRNFDCKKI